MGKNRLKKGEEQPRQNPNIADATGNTPGLWSGLSCRQR